jgi:hypothetical protein
MAVYCKVCRTPYRKSDLGKKCTVVTDAWYACRKCGGRIGSNHSQDYCPHCYHSPLKSERKFVYCEGTIIED